MIKLKNLISERDYLSDDEIDLYELRVSTAGKLGIDYVYRTDALDMYKDKSVWGKGWYFSLSKKESEYLSKTGNIIKYKVSPNMKLLVADLTYGRSTPVKPPKLPKDWSDTYDYDILRNMLDKNKDLSRITNADGLVLYSDSPGWGFSQLVVFDKGKQYIEKI